MSLSRTKTALRDALNLSQTPVIALHGAWGTGKTHLYRELAAELEKSGSFTPLDISCLGYSSVAALKSAVIAMLLARTSKAAKHGQTLANLAVGLLNKRLPEDFQIRASLADLQPLLPKLKELLPTNALLAVDDIERASDLNPHELLGFVSFLGEKLGVRVLLILNKDKLSDRLEAWEQLREKIVNLEIALEADPEECVRIGLGEMPSGLRALMADRCRALGVSNIRAIQHMRRTYNALNAAVVLTEGASVQLVPSIVLFVALYFQAIEHAPSLGVVLEQRHMLYGDDKELSAEQRRGRQRIRDYGLGPPDRFEHEVLVPFLRTGYLNSDALSAYLAELGTRERRRTAELALESFLDQRYWDATATHADLVAHLDSVKGHVADFDERQISRLAHVAADLVGSDVVDDLVEAWLAARREDIASRQFDEWHFDQHSELRRLHPKVAAAFRAQYDALFPPISLAEAVQFLSRKSSWGRRQALPVETATRESIEQLLRESDAATRSALFAFFAPYMQARMTGGGFHQAAALFAEVCRSILATESSTRLADVVRQGALYMGFSEALQVDCAPAAQPGVANTGATEDS